MEGLFQEITKENFPYLQIELNIQVCELRERYFQNVMRYISRNVTIKLPSVQDKERLLKVPRGKKYITYKGISLDLPEEIL